MNSLNIFNSKTNTQELCIPNKPPQVSVYTCGPTLYQPPHIGNLRCFVFADVLRRTLVAFGYKPKYVINLTDVGHLVSDADEGEDKIEMQAKKEKRTAKDVVAEMQECFFFDLSNLNIPRKNYTFPKASQYIKEQIELTKRLEEKGLTYSIEDGLYFDTSKYKEYGQLGGHIKNAESRVETNPQKRNVKDFALWRKTPSNTTKQQEWDSPWGRGVPGWHLECSAMAMKLLGEQIDIHTGGADHLHIHHNNEIAQSEGATGKTFANYWLHVAFLSTDKQKISKSLGNTILLKDIINRKIDPLSLRYLFLLTSYRTPLSFSFESLYAADTALRHLRSEFQSTKTFFSWLTPPSKKFVEDFNAALSDDLNTPKALGCVWSMLKDKDLPGKVKNANLRFADKVLGVSVDKKVTIEKPPQNIVEISRERDLARKAKEYSKADALREKLQKLGWEVLDTEDGTLIHKTVSNFVE